jgi:hypothetical protein
VKELDRIKIAEHFNFELLLEGSDLGWGSRNCWSLKLVVLHIKLGRKSC